MAITAWLDIAFVRSWHSILGAGFGEGMLESAKVAELLTASGSAGRLSALAWTVGC